MKDYYVVIEDSWGDSIEISNRGVLPGTTEKGILISCNTESGEGEISFSKEDIDIFIDSLQEDKEVLSRGGNTDE